MSNDDRDIWVDGALYNRNRNRFTLEELTPYAGQYVAFNLEGSRILASGADRSEVEARLVAAGLNPARAVVERIPALDEDTWL